MNKEIVLEIVDALVFKYGFDKPTTSIFVDERIHKLWHNTGDVATYYEYRIGFQPDNDSYGVSVITSNWEQTLFEFVTKFLAKMKEMEEVKPDERIEVNADIPY